MKRHTICAIWILLWPITLTQADAASNTSLTIASLPSDDFDDNSRGELWSLLETDPDSCWLDEINGRLELRATGTTYDDTAIYISDGWALDVTQDFSVRVDYHYEAVSQSTEEGGTVRIGLVPSNSTPYLKRVTIDAGSDLDQSESYFSYELYDGFLREYVVTDRPENSGTLYISYESSTDELYLSTSGYGPVHAWQTVTGLLQTEWGGSPALVGLGGGSEYLVTNSGDAYLDNFVVDYGRVIRDGQSPVQEVPVDVKPQSCPNQLNLKSKGVLPVAILGTEEFDVMDIDPAIVRLSRNDDGDAGVAPLRWSYEDVATPFEGELCDCHTLGPDGLMDLSLKFDVPELVEQLDLADIPDKATTRLVLVGELKEDFGGTPVRGEDCVRVQR